MNTLQNSLTHTAVPMQYTNCNVLQPLPENQQNCILEAERETTLIEDNPRQEQPTTDDDHVASEDCNLHIEKLHACDTSNIDINIPSAVLQRNKERLDNLKVCKQIERLKKTIRMQSMLLSRKRAEISNLKKKMKNHKHSKFYLLTELSKYIEGAPFTFLRMQLMHKDCTPWTEDEKELSLAMYYKASKLYRFLIREGFKLPSCCTIRKWIING